MLVSDFWDQQIVQIMLHSPNENNLDKWGKAFFNATQGSSKTVFVARVIFPFFFSRLVSRSVGCLEEPVTEVFSTSILSFSSLVWSLFSATSDMWNHSTTILSAHLLIAFLTLHPPVTRALIVIQSFAKIEKEFQCCISDVYIECQLHTNCSSIYPLAVPNIGYYWWTGMKRKIYKDYYLSIVCLSSMRTVYEINLHFW